MGSHGRTAELAHGTHLLGAETTVEKLQAEPVQPAAGRLAGQVVEEHAVVDLVHPQGREQQPAGTAVRTGDHQAGLDGVQVVQADFPLGRQGRGGGLCPGTVGLLLPGAQQVVEGAAVGERRALFVDEQKAHAQVRRQVVGLPVLAAHAHLKGAQDDALQFLVERALTQAEAVEDAVDRVGQGYQPPAHQLGQSAQQQEQLLR